MAAPMAKNVLVGSDNGILKFIDVEKKNWQNVTRTEKPDRTQAICNFCWESVDETRAIFGLQNRKIKIFDLESQKTDDIFQVPGEDKLCGVLYNQKYYITALETGKVNFWDCEELTEHCSFQVGSIHRIRLNPKNKNILATGGKDNDLKIWDVNDVQKPIFQAKNVRNDWLDLQVPVWITDMHFLDNNKIVACSGYHTVRVYDPNGVQRRPVMDFGYGEYPFMCMTLLPNGNQVIVGDTVGKMALMDLRKGAMVQLYKGFGGGVAAVEAHPSMNIVVSASHDRHVRVHDITSKKLLQKFYMKSRLNSLLLSSKGWQSRKANDDDDDDEKGKKHKLSDEETSDVEEEDELWDNLQTTEKVKSKDSEKTIKSKKKKMK